METNTSSSDEFYQKLWDSANSITKDWILISTPLPVLSILALYLLVVLKWGPRFMEGRSPYKLDTVMRVYNLVQVVSNAALLFTNVWRYLSSVPYVLQLSCRLPMDFDDYHFKMLREAYFVILHGYFLLKILDLSDTVFMVLRKKFSHITFLHVYHHASMVFFSWYTIKYAICVQAVLPGIINIIVHIVMYTYYFLSTFGEPVKKYLWWKIYLTKLQLGQFVVVLIYISALYYNDCPISEVFTYIWVFNVFVFFCLFLNFYIRAYIFKSVEHDKSKHS